MYCVTCGINAERTWCPYCGEDMLEVDDAQLYELQVEAVASEPRRRRRKRRKKEQAS